MKTEKVCDVSKRCQQQYQHYHEGFDTREGLPKEVNEESCFIKKPHPVERLVPNEHDRDSSKVLLGMILVPEREVVRWKKEEEHV